MAVQLKCEKCFKILQICPACKGKCGTNTITCSNCRTTGLVCPEHGGIWKR